MMWGRCWRLCGGEVGRLCADDLLIDAPEGERG